MINSILDHLILLDQEIKVTDFIIENGLEIQIIETRNIRKFYSKLLEKLIINEHANKAINLLKFCISKEYGELDDELVKKVNNSKLKYNQK